VPEGEKGVELTHPGERAVGRGTRLVIHIDEGLFRARSLQKAQCRIERIPEDVIAEVYPPEVVGIGYIEAVSRMGSGATVAARARAPGRNVQIVVPDERS